MPSPAPTARLRAGLTLTATFAVSLAGSAIGQPTPPASPSPTTLPAAPASRPAPKPRPFFVGERIAAKKHEHSRDYEWAVIRKVGKYYVYVEWEDWEGFTGDWLPPERLRRDNPLTGTAAPPRKSKRKLATIPPEPDAPTDLPRDPANRAGAGAGPLRPVDPASIPKKEDIDELLKSAPPLVIPADLAVKNPAATGTYKPSVPSLAPPANPDQPLRISSAFAGRAPTDFEPLFTFGPAATRVVLARLSTDNAPLLTKADLITGQTLGTSTLLPNRKLIGISPDTNYAITAAGFWGDLIEVWDISTETAKRLSLFTFRDDANRNLSPNFAHFLPPAAPNTAPRCALGAGRIVFLDLAPLLARAATQPTAALPTIYRAIRADPHGAKPTACPDPNFFLLSTRDGHLLLRADGTLAANVNVSGSEPLAFSPDGRRAVRTKTNSIHDLPAGPGLATKGEGTNLVALLDNTLGLSPDGNLIDLKTSRIVWRYRTGSADDPQPFEGIPLAGRVWTFHRDKGTLTGHVIPTAEALAARDSPPPELTIPLAGKSIAIEYALDPAENAEAIQSLVEKMVTATGAKPAATTGPHDFLLKVSSKRENVERTYSFNSPFNNPFFRGKDAPPPPQGPQKVSCPTNSVSLSLKQPEGKKPLWSSTLFAGASYHISIPAGTDLQTYANSLFKPADELLKDARLPNPLRDPATDERITTYLPN